MQTKVEFRTLLKARRDALSQEDRAAWSSTIANHLRHLCLDRNITRIGAFWPLGSEIDLRHAVSNHPEWSWFFPKVTSTRPPRLAWGTQPLEQGRWGLMEPKLTQHFLPPVQLVLVPGLAFDEAGHRMGYGGGFYDALLLRLPDNTLTVGVGFESQMNVSVPKEPHDWPVQALLSEAGFRPVNAPG